VTRQPDEDDAVRRWRAWSGDGQSEVDVDDRRPASFAPGEGESSDEDDRAEPSEGRRPRTGALGAALPAPAAPSRTTEATTAAPTAWTARGMGMVGVVLILALVLVGSLLGLHRHASAERASGPSLAPAVLPAPSAGRTGEASRGAASPGAASESGHPLLNLLSDVVPKVSSMEESPLPTTIEAGDSVPTTVYGLTPEMLMADGDSRTAWQTQGDGTGRQITVEFPQQRTVTQVGLINGDADGAKYAAERRILKVRWTFDDGRSVIQTLRDGDPEPQVIGISAEITTNIHITLLEVSDSTSVEDDYTAISELRLSGWVD
jgi:hypothetical protein